MSPRRRPPRPPRPSFPAELADEALLAGLGTGDETATVAFVRRFQARVLGVALAVTGDAGLAQDVAQQAFVKAWRRSSTFDPVRGSVAGWLTVITRNLAIDAVRVRTPVPVDADGLVGQVLWPPAAHRTPEQAALAGDADRGLRAALRALPAEQARAVVLAGIGGLSATEVAATEGIPLGTAKTRIRSGMRRLRRALAVGEPVDE